VAMLPEPGGNAAEYLASLKGEEHAVFTTILPAAAAIRRRYPKVDFRELIAETKDYCIGEIDWVY